jgi:hypothetical protein
MRHGALTLGLAATLSQPDLNDIRAEITREDLKRQFPAYRGGL